MTQAAVAFGGNVGRPERAFGFALDGLATTPGLRVLRVSSLHRSAPWGVLDQPDFLNGVVLVGSEMDAPSLLRRLHELEDAAGRDRGGASGPWGPRPLDLDLLWFGSTIDPGNSPTLPHPRLGERTFVLMPLAEVAPEWRHPANGRSAADLLEELRGSGRATACEPIPGVRVGDGPIAREVGA